MHESLRKPTFMYWVAHSGTIEGSSWLLGIVAGMCDGGHADFGAKYFNNNMRRSSQTDGVVTGDLDQQ